MKKLMMAVAIVCAAVAANAATYDWNASGNFYWADTVEGTELTGSTIYVFDGNAGYTTASILSALGTSTDILDSALGSGTVDEYAGFSFSGTGISDDGNTPATINAILVAVTADEKFATTMAYNPIEVSDAVIASGANVMPDWAVANLPADGAAGWTSVAPEPTSGLLLLIGVAGLALRRRRA